MTTRNYCTVHEAALALSPSQLSLLLVGGDTVGVHWPPLLCTSAMDPLDTRHRKIQKYCLFYSAKIAFYFKPFK